MTRVKIASRDNARLKLAKKVRDGQQDDLMFVEGLRLAEEAVRSDIKIEFCVVTSDFGGDKREGKFLDILSETGVEIFKTGNRIFSSLAATRSPQGIILICARPVSDQGAFNDRTQKRDAALPIITMLSEVNNPSNLGAILRTAEAAGANGVIVSKGSADCFSPKAVRASMGSAFRIKIWAEAGVSEVTAFAERMDYKMTAVAVNANSAYTEIDWKVPRLLIFGSEAHGVPAEILASVNETISIPMNPKVESLNLAVAAGIILFEARRQKS